MMDLSPYALFSVLAVTFGFGVAGCLLALAWFVAAMLGSLRPRPTVNGRILPEVLD